MKSSRFSSRFAWVRLCAATTLLLALVSSPRRLGNDRWAFVGPGRPPPFAVDVWGGAREGGDTPLVVRQQVERQLLFEHSPLRQPVPTGPEAPGAAVSPPRPEGGPLGALGPLGPLANEVGGGLGSGFLTVGDVAVAAGIEEIVAVTSTGFAVSDVHLAALSTRFIAAFGDDFHQLAVFLTFRDAYNPQALAYQQAVKNDDKGLGLGLFDHSERFGSAGKLETVLNMKRIGPYGRDASEDPENGLYAVWAQEAAHRWLVYFRFQRTTDSAPNKKLLGRQEAHWTRFVQSDASIMDGFLWKDNGDGTYTPAEAGKRWGALDQYGMGLRSARDVPPFFFLEDVVDESGNKVEMARLSRTGRYMGKKTDLTIADIVRAAGAREPAVDDVAQDMRMGVALLGTPRETPLSLVGEAARIDHTRKLWTTFYDAAAGGRGAVCTNLWRPCRGDAWRFEGVTLGEAPEVKTRDGALGPGEPLVLTATLVNVGTEAGRPKVKASGRGRLQLATELLEAPAAVAPGQRVTLYWKGRAAADLSCGTLLNMDFTASGRKAPSRGTASVSVGLVPGMTDTLEDATAASTWRVNPEGMDTAKEGKWALGTPKETKAFDVILQPGSTHSGSRAFVTGVSADEADNVDGVTTLESPSYSITGLHEPHLTYQVHFVDAHLDNEVLRASGAGRMRVLASLDGGAWTEVDRVAGMTVGWQQRLVRLGEALGPLEVAKAVRLRFAVEEEGEKRPVVEAVIDDVSVVGESLGCGNSEPPPPEPAPAPPSRAETDGCACAVAGASRRAREGGAAWLIALGVVATLTYRNRRR